MCSYQYVAEYESVHSVEQDDELYIFNIRTPSICCALYVNFSFRQLRMWDIQTQTYANTITHVCTYKTHTHYSKGRRYMDTQHMLTRLSSVTHECASTTVDMKDLYSNVTWSPISEAPYYKRNYSYNCLIATVLSDITNSLRYLVDVNNSDMVNSLSRSDQHTLLNLISSFSFT